MQIQTPVIEVDRTDRCHLIVHNDSLRMDKARRILEDPHSCFDQLVVIWLGYQIHQLLIRDTRRNDAHINSAFCRKCQRCHHLIINNQIRCCDIDIMLCLVDHVQIDILSDNLIIHRRVAIRLNVSIREECHILIFLWWIRRIIIFLAGQHQPCLQEHQRQVPDSLALQHDTGILPMSKPWFLVDIFIRQIDTTGKSDITINDRNLPVVTVVLSQVKDWTNRVKRCNLDSLLLHILDESGRNPHRASKIIIDQTHIHALFCFPLHDFQDRIPHLALLDDKILHKYKMICIV